MEELNNSSVPIFKKIDREVFDRINKFKLTPGYNNLQDFYNGLEEDLQRLFKGAIIIFIFLLPVLLLGIFWWQNQSLKEDLETRVALISKANEVIGQSQGLREIGPNILTTNPIDSASMMTTRLSQLLSTVGVDLSKIQVSNFTGERIAGTVFRAEADFAFTNLSTDELMNVFTAMIRNGKFRINSVDIKRNPETNLLSGRFHAIHFSTAPSEFEE